MLVNYIWCNYSTSAINRLKVAYNDAYRILRGMPRYHSAKESQTYYNIDSFYALQRKITYKFVERCHLSQNLWLKMLMSSDCFYDSVYYDHYCGILFVNEYKMMYVAPFRKRTVPAVQSFYIFFVFFVCVYSACSCIWTLWGQWVKRGLMDKKWTNNFDPLFPLKQQFWHLHMTQHRILHTPSGLPWWHKPSLWQQWRHVLSKNHGQAILTPYSPLCHRFNTVTWLSIEFSTHPVGCHGGTSRRYGNNDVIKPWPSDFDPLFPFVPPFQHCHITQHRILHTPSGLPWWHKPSLWQQWRHVLSKNHGQAILTPYSPLCQRFNTVTWLSIEFPTHPVGCHGGTSRRYGNNDVMFCPKTMAKRFWPPIPLCATISTPSHDSASNSPHTQWVAMVAQAVAMTTICLFQNAKVL